MGARMQNGTPIDQQSNIVSQAGQVAPVIWLLGKVQSGKSSIIHALTRGADAAIGDGISACTKTARAFDFPSDAPVIRFLDTRGVGEANYDPAEDLALAAERAHCIIAVMRAMDAHQQSVLEVLKDVRRKKPDWPIIVAQTHLHEGYEAGRSHILPYPYQIATPDTLSSTSDSPTIPDDLRRALAYQRSQLNELPGTGSLSVVPIDFTQPADGFDPQHYGLAELEHVVKQVAPDALSMALREAQQAEEHGARGAHHALISSHAAAASAADLIPVAAVVAVPGVQANLLRKLANAYGLNWTRRLALEFAAALGLGLAARYAAAFGIRQLTKLIPVYGQTAGAAAAAATSFATTFALGKAALYFLANRKRGDVDTSEVKAVWSDALTEAFSLAKLRGLAQADDSTPDRGNK